MQSGENPQLKYLRPEFKKGLWLTGKTSPAVLSKRSEDPDRKRQGSSAVLVLYNRSQSARPAGNNRIILLISSFVSFVTHLVSFVVNN